MSSLVDLWPRTEQTTGTLGHVPGRYAEGKITHVQMYLMVLTARRPGYKFSSLQRGDSTAVSPTRFSR